MDTVEAEIHAELKNIRELFLCSVCSNWLNKPTQLPCGHIFCEDCLSTLHLKQNSTCRTCSAKFKLTRRSRREKNRIARNDIVEVGLKFKLLEKTLLQEISKKNSAPCHPPTVSSTDSSQSSCGCAEGETQEWSGFKSFLHRRNSSRLISQKVCENKENINDEELALDLATTPSTRAEPENKTEKDQVNPATEVKDALEEKVKVPDILADMGSLSHVEDKVVGGDGECVSSTRPSQSQNWLHEKSVHQPSSQQLTQTRPLDLRTNENKRTRITIAPTYRTALKFQSTWIPLDLTCRKRDREESLIIDEPEAKRLSQRNTVIIADLKARCLKGADLESHVDQEEEKQDIEKHCPTEVETEEPNQQDKYLTSSETKNLASSSQSAFALPLPSQFDMSFPQKSQSNKDKPLAVDSTKQEARVDDNDVFENSILTADEEVDDNMFATPVRTTNRKSIRVIRESEKKDDDYKDTYESESAFEMPLPSQFDLYNENETGAADVNDKKMLAEEKSSTEMAAEEGLEEDVLFGTPVEKKSRSRIQPEHLPSGNKSLKRVVDIVENSSSPFGSPFPSQFNFNSQPTTAAKIGTVVETEHAKDNDMEEEEQDIIPGTPENEVILEEIEVPQNTKMSSTSKMFASSLPSPLNLSGAMESQKSQPRRKFVFCPSRLNRSELAKLSELCSISNGTISKDYTDDVTHLIIKLEKGRVPQTMKYLFAIADKKWIVVYDWVLECVLQGEIVPEESYETSCFPECDSGVRKSRLNPGKLLQGVCCYFPTVLRSSGASMEDCKKLVEKMGATIANSLYEANQDLDPGVMIIGEGIQSRHLYQEWYKSKGWLSVTWGWILDCLLSYSVVPLTKSHLLTKLDGSQPNLPKSLKRALGSAQECTPNVKK